MVTKEWVAVHRKHHRYCEKVGDPHSPHQFGLLRVLFSGVFLYVDATKDKLMIDTYGVGTPDDWVERNIYSKYPTLGITLFLALNIYLFSWWGLLIWLIQMAWIPFWAAGVINGLGHWFGYRNNDTNDKSRNIIPFGFLIGGEELHNNHHDNPASPKLSQKWWEFDVGWLWLKLFQKIGLAKIVERDYANT